MDVFSAPHFTDDAEARKYLEALRWPSGVACPHCGVIDRAYATKKTGVYRCGEPECRKDFTVTTRTVMESSHIKLHKWLQGFYLMAASKKGMSAHQLHRMLGITYKSAWFMAHRIREAMRAGGLAPLGGEGKVVEVDETYFGKVEEARVSPQRKGRPFTKSGKAGPSSKRAIVALVERGGSARTFHVAVADKGTVSRMVRENVARESRLHTDESRLYGSEKEHFAAHETVRHSIKEYARGDVNTNSAEGYFSIFKRGMRGVYHHCAEKHLHRYLSEFDFRYCNRVALGVGDKARAERAIKGGENKRLTYQQPNSPGL